VQVKLLRVLQEQEFERIGGTQTIKVDARVIAATHRDLQQLMREGKFREDLYYRLNVIPIHIPPLRERKADTPLLVEFLLGRFAAKGKGKATTVSPRAMTILMDHQWPGNVRELENALEHAMVCSRGSRIEPEALPRSLLTGQTISPPPAGKVEPRAGSPASTPTSEKETILRALESSRWKRGLAATHLGMDRTTLWRRMRRFGITPPDG
jgi:DNA-binding NtrC family response regulator